MAFADKNIVAKVNILKMGRLYIPQPTTVKLLWERKMMEINMKVDELEKAVHDKS